MAQSAVCKLVSCQWPILLQVNNMSAGMEAETLVRHLNVIRNINRIIVLVTAQCFKGWFHENEASKIVPMLASQVHGSVRPYCAQWVAIGPICGHVCNI
jgi:hypothetical protein